MPGLPLADTESAFEAGRACGFHGAFLFLVAVLLVGLWRAYSRKPEVNRNCVRGLMTVLAAWIAFLLAAWVRGTDQSPGYLAVPVALVAMAAAPAGIVLAIVGLAQCGRAPQPTRGHGRAILAVVLGSFFLLVLGLAFLYVVLERYGPFEPRAEVAFGTVTSPFGYTLDLKGTPWKRWTDVADSVPEADLAGQRGAGGCFVAAALYYGDEKPHAEALNKALLSVLNIGPQESKLTDAGPVREAGMEGRAYRYLYTDDGGTTYEYRIRMLEGPQCAYFLAVWGVKGRTPVDAWATEFFSRVRFQGDRPVEVAPEALTAAQRKAQALLQNHIGASYFKTKQYDRALAHFRRAAEGCPTDTDFLCNVLHALHRLGRHDEALAWIDQRFAPLSSAQDVRSWKALHLKALGRAEEAIAVFRQLFADGWHDDEDFKAYIDLLSEAKRWSDAHAAFASYLKTHDSPDLHLRRAELVHEQGDHAAAVALLKSLQARRGYSTDIAYALAHAYSALEQPKEALAVCDEMIARGYGSADAYYLKGDAEYDLKWYRQARESWTKALELSPRDEAIQRALRAVSAMLGEGDNACLRTAIEPVPLPRALADRLPPVTARGGDGYGAFYLSRITGCAFARGKDLRWTQYQRIKVLDAGGVSRFSTLELDFDPLGEDVFVNDLVIRDDKGQVVSRGQLADYYVVDKQNSQVASHDRTLHLPVPHLQPGHTIELAVTSRWRGEPKEFNFQRYPLKAMRPVLLSAVYYLGDAREIRHKASRVPGPEAIDGGLVWVLKDLAAFQSEPMQPEYETIGPMVYVADAKAAWETEAAEYLKKIAEKVVLDEKTRNQAQALAAQAPDRGAKVAAVAGYVQKTVTYKAIEFGRRALIPNTPAETLARKYGDCKDHAVLLQQMLAAVGIPSHLALVAGGNVLQEDLPSLDQFNHMVVWVPEGAGGRFLDATDKEANLAAALAWNLGGRTALVLDPARPRLAKIPAYGPGASRARIERRVEVLPDRTVRVRETAVLEGYAGGFLRRHLKSMDPAAHLEWAQGFVGDFVSGAKVKFFRVSDLYDNARPSTAEWEYEVKDGAALSGGDLVVRLPHPWEREYLVVQPTKRQEPFETKCPFDLESRVTVTAPAGYAVAAAPAAPAAGEGPGGRWQAGVETARDGCTVRMTFSRTVGTFPADQYARYHGLTEAALGAVAREVRCKPAGKAGP